MSTIHGLLITLMMLPTAVLAQRALTLEACLRLARERSIAVRREDIAYRATQLTRTEIHSTGLPQVKLNAGASYAPWSGLRGYDPAITEGGQLAGQVVVQESLYDGGIRGLKTDQLSLELDRLTDEKRAVQRDLNYTVTSLFIEALRAEREVALQAASEQQLEDYLGLLDQMMHGGGSSQTDILRTRVQRDNARMGLARASQEAALAKLQLAEAMGTPGDTAFALAGTLDIPADSVGIAPEDTTLETIDLRMARLDLQKSLLDVEVSQREHWPTLSLMGDVGLLTSVNNMRLPQEERLNGLGYSIGVLVEVPLFTWGGISSRIEQRQVAVEGQRLGVEQLSRTLRRDLLSIRVQMENTLGTLRSLQSTLRAAEDNYLLTKSKFAGGGTLSLEVLNAQQLLADSRLMELQALATWHTLKAKYEQLHTQ
jgi:cobalt-zinc-cadmium efflux system outer membrane protein